MANCDSLVCNDDFFNTVNAVIFDAINGWVTDVKNNSDLFHCDSLVCNNYFLMLPKILVIVPVNDRSSLLLTTAKTI